MPLYIADQFCELSKFDPAGDRRITGAGRRIVALRAASLDDAYHLALHEAQDTERSYIRMSADAPQYFREQLGMADRLVDELLPLPSPAFDHYRLLGVGNVADVPGAIWDLDEPGCGLLRSFPIASWTEPEGRLPALEVTVEGFEDRVEGETPRFVEMRFLERSTGRYLLQTLCLRTTERDFSVSCMEEANRIAELSAGSLCFVDVINYAVSLTGWVDGVYELMDEFTYDPAFVDFYECLRLHSGRLSAAGLHS